jgi:hypothetical protein
VPKSLVGPLWIRKERKKLVNKLIIISKIQASKLPTVPESQVPIDNGQFRKGPNSIAVFRPLGPVVQSTISANPGLNFNLLF